MKRLGMTIRVRPGKLDQYKELHAAAWPDVLKKLSECCIRNYSIYQGEDTAGATILFSYFEYHGSDFEADMAKMAADETTQRWWKACEVCVAPLRGKPVGQAGEWWHMLEEVFHHE